MLTKNYAITDIEERPIALHPTSASVSGFTGAGPLQILVPEKGALHGDKVYVSDRSRETVEAQGFGNKSMNPLAFL